VTQIQVFVSGFDTVRAANIGGTPVRDGRLSPTFNKKIDLSNGELGIPSRLQMPHTHPSRRAPEACSPTTKAPSHEKPGETSLA
jgi:hypothetical protein